MNPGDHRRWERLLGDLSAQFEAAADAERDTEVRDRTRGELARLRLVDRLDAAIGHPVAADVLGAGPVRGVLRAVGPDWLLLDAVPTADVLVAVAAVTAMSGLGRSSAPPGAAGEVRARLGLAHALRGLARSRAPVAVTTVDAAVYHGTIDRVGSDYLEVAEHPAGEPRRAGAVGSVRTIPLHAVAVVRAR